MQDLLTMTSMESLPYELIYEIINYLQDSKSLCIVARCSKRLHAIAIPLLYSWIRFDTRLTSTTGDYLDHTLWHTVHDFRKFVIHIWKYPRYAEHIHSLLYANYDCKGPSEAEYLITYGQRPNPPFEKVTDATLVRAVKSLSVDTEEADAWLADLNPSCCICFDALFGLLLPKLPKLKHLGVLMLNTGTVYFRRTLERTVDNSQLSLQSVQSITDFSWNNNTTSEVDLIAAYLQLPSVQAISIKLELNINDFTSLSPIIQPTLTYLHLRVDFYIIAHSDNQRTSFLDLLGDFVKSCPSLKTFILELRQLSDFLLQTSSHGTNNMMSAVMQTLKTRNKTLQNLSFKFGEPPMGGPIYDQIGAHSFKAFSDLRHLRIFSTAVVDQRSEQIGGGLVLKWISLPSVGLGNLLPPSIEILHLQYAHENEVPAVINLVRDFCSTQRSMLPNLHTVIIEGAFRGTVHSYKDPGTRKPFKMREIVQAAKAAGILLRIFNVVDMNALTRPLHVEETLLMRPNPAIEWGLDGPLQSGNCFPPQWTGNYVELYKDMK